jgi:hypothetical protein
MLWGACNAQAPSATTVTLGATSRRHRRMGAAAHCIRRGGKRIMVSSTPLVITPVERGQPTGMASQETPPFARRDTECARSLPCSRAARKAVGLRQAAPAERRHCAANRRPIVGREAPRSKCWPPRPTGLADRYGLFPGRTPAWWSTRWAGGVPRSHSSSRRAPSRSRRPAWSTLASNSIGRQHTGQSSIYRWLPDDTST